MDRVENQDADRLDDVEPLHWCQLYLHHRAWPRPKPQKAGGYEGCVDSARGGRVMLGRGGRLSSSERAKRAPTEPRRGQLELLAMNGQEHE